MQYSTFGSITGLRVSEFALGTANFGTACGSGAGPDGARQLFDRYTSAGGCFIDTASNYQDGEAEKVLAGCITSERDHLVLASKFGRGSGRKTHVSAAGNSRRAMVQSVEKSLRNLRTDRLDLFWVHYDDGVTPIDEIIRSFDDLVSSGKVLYAGVSNFPAWRVARGQTIAELRGLSPLVGIQVEHSLVERTAERELIPMAEAFGLGVALYSPLGGGLLTGKYRGAAVGRQTSLPDVVYREDSPAKTAALDAVVEVADEIGVPPAAVAVAWQREFARRSATTVVTLIGPRTMKQLDSYMASLDVRLDGEQFDKLSHATAIRWGVPYESIAGPPDMGDRDRLERHTVRIR
ncbi:aldo/keto reductase [Rhodococcus sp. IEGM 1307]|jgi:aryl-alcohol dehydrogenase-like predicted oxidoreductase|uniref:aldo/keto reductase n=1 Tax=Rhodococcus sp. IEGM 1307 TaxID=3047091 RepID=UPI0024B700C3|nr:aldo/keto reductase [Rhodococcus sp. IEGM 1307]MDI9980094.1 aldo/keto reductase [Rhodococcus sp. IEGM 1307]